MSQRPRATDILFRACKYRFQPATPYHNRHDTHRDEHGEGVVAAHDDRHEEAEERREAKKHDVVVRRPEA